MELMAWACRQAPSRRPDARFVGCGRGYEALRWFTAEHSVLLAATQLAWSLFHFLDGQGHWHDHVAVQQAGLAAAQRLGVRAIEILAHRLVARAHIQLGQFDDAYAHLHRALDRAAHDGDLAAQANIHNSLGHLRDRQGRYEDALGHAQRAMELFQAIGNPHGQAPFGVWRAIQPTVTVMLTTGQRQQAETSHPPWLHLPDQQDDRRSVPNPTSVHIGSPPIRCP
jgi:tetratricopeptide (TPR) repeat protein